MIKGLSKYQSQIVSALREDGVYLWTNEGPGYRAWIGDKNGVIINYVRVRSAEALVNTGVIKFVDGNYRQGLFKYTLKVAEYYNRKEAE
ncbi:hypothetical protein [Mesobacillus zeae]|uniref:Uncharacterized protein n=1 Tax=Mesobacillus zeae TaxID=1917180 RepID=A0A398BFY5_9BACI|nr:hypothetical protein [Mesobacillus zeae]RID88962.1 hypothetical protein D1970_00225 [Mesobacillus zeae]